eukprot:gene18307-13155_t
MVDTTTEYINDDSTTDGDDNDDVDEEEKKNENGAGANRRGKRRVPTASSRRRSPRKPTATDRESVVAALAASTTPVVSAYQQNQQRKRRKRLLPTLVPLPVPLAQIYLPQSAHTRLARRMLRWQAGGVMGAGRKALQWHRPILSRRQTGYLYHEPHINVHTGQFEDPVRRRSTAADAHPAPSTATTTATAAAAALPASSSSARIVNEERQRVNWEHILIVLELIRDIAMGDKPVQTGPGRLTEPIRLRIHPDLPAIPLDDLALTRIRYHLTAVFTNFLREHEAQHQPLKSTMKDRRPPSHAFLAAVPQVIRQPARYPRGCGGGGGSHGRPPPVTAPPSFLLFDHDTVHAIEAAQGTATSGVLHANADGDDADGGAGGAGGARRGSGGRRDPQAQLQRRQRLVYGYGASSASLLRTPQQQEQQKPPPLRSTSPRRPPNLHTFPRPAVLAAQRLSQRYQDYMQHGAWSSSLLASKPIIVGPRARRAVATPSASNRRGDGDGGDDASLSPGASVAGSVHEYDLYPPLPSAFAPPPVLVSPSPPPLSSSLPPLNVKTEPEAPPRRVAMTRSMRQLVANAASSPPTASAASVAA